MNPVSTEYTDHMNGIAIIHWESDELIGDPSSLKLKDEVKGVLSRGIKKLIVDFSRLKNSNSSGLGILLSAWNLAFNQHADLVVVVCSDRVRDIFNVTKLSAIMHMYESIDEALNHYRE